MCTFANRAQSYLPRYHRLLCCYAYSNIRRPPVSWHVHVYILLLRPVFRGPSNWRAYMPTRTIDHSYHRPPHLSATTPPANRQSSILRHSMSHIYKNSNGTPHPPAIRLSRRSPTYDGGGPVTTIRILGRPFLISIIAYCNANVNILLSFLSVVSWQWFEAYIWVGLH